MNSDEIDFRQACETDVDTLALLVGELGYSTEISILCERLSELNKAGDIALVALHRSAVIGLALLHRTYFLHRPADGRISTLVVFENYRGRGVGTRLIKEAESIFRSWGCGRIEVTSGAQREAAHRFYNRAGYSEQPKRFVKTLAEELPNKSLQQSG